MLKARAGLQVCRVREDRKGLPEKEEYKDLQVNLIYKLN